MKKFRRPIVHSLWIILSMLEASLSCFAAGPKPEVSKETFVNPLYEGADPWIVRQEGFYYLCKSDFAHSISVWKSERLTDRGERKEVWKPPQSGWNTSGVWAPELHFLQGRWYIYYAADAGHNASHRMGVLQSKSDDPRGEYTDLGMLYTGDDIESKTNNRWAIDGTVLELEGQLYFIWSGWPGEEDIQYLYIARMENPWTIATARVKLCDNANYLWERMNEDPHQRGLNEGPQILKHEGRVFLIYSCSGAWLASYKLGLLELKPGSDPMDPAHWTKHPEPVFQRTDRVHGPGHASFVKSPDGTEDWIVYHAKVEPEPGWKRMVSIQPFSWRENGLPDFGTPLPPGTAIKKPAGE